MKIKIMALILAVGLGVTGVAVTAQAAEEEAGCSDPDWFKTIITYFVDATFGNPDGQFSTYRTSTYCSACDTVASKDTIKYESHDYEQKFEDNGRVLLECTACHDTYYQF